MATPDNNDNSDNDAYCSRAYARGPDNNPAGLGMATVTAPVRIPPLLSLLSLLSGSEEHGRYHMTKAPGHGCYAPPQLQLGRASVWSNGPSWKPLLPANRADGSLSEGLLEEWGAPGPPPLARLMSPTTSPTVSKRAAPITRPNPIVTPSQKTTRTKSQNRSGGHMEKPNKRVRL
jgi:hypothetical protein